MNNNTIQLTLKVKDDGSVVVDQAAGKIEQFGEKNQKAAQTSASAWSKVKSAWLEIIGAVYAMKKAWDYMDMAAKAEQAEVAFRNISESLGVNADDMVAKMKKASRETIDDSHLMQKALKAMAQDVDPNKIPQLFDAARVGAVKAGEDIGDVADQIIDAIANEMPRGLRKFGLITKEQMSVFNKAVTAGAENLNLLDLVLANAALQEANLALQSDNSAIAMQRFKAQIDELKETLGGWLLTALQKAWGGLQWLATGASMAAAGFYSLAAGIGQALAAINEKLGRIDAAKKFRAEAEEMKKIADDLSGSADELMGKAMGNITGQVGDTSGKTKDDWAKQQAEAQKQIDAWMAKAKAAGEASKKAQELENAIKKITEATQQSRENVTGIQVGAYAKEMEMIKNDVEEYQKAGVSKEKIEEYVAARTAEIRAAVQQKIQDDISTSLENIKALHEGSFAHEIALLNKKAEDYRKEGATEMDIAAYVAARTAELRETAAKQIQDDTKTSLETIKGLQEGAYAKEIADLNRKVEEYRKAGAAEVDIAAYVEARKKEIALTVSKDKLDAERDLYKDLRQYSGEYFEATKKLIDEQARKYRALGIDEVAVAAWVKEETINAYIEMAEKSDNWMSGVEAGLLKIKKDAMTTGKAMSETVTEFENQASQTLSTSLFDAWKGQLKSFGDYWNTFWDAMAKKIFDVFSKKVVDDMLIKLTGWLDTSKTTASGQTKNAGGFMGWLGSLLGGGDKKSAIAGASSSITTTGNIYINTTGSIFGVGTPGAAGATAEGAGDTENVLSSFWTKIQGWFGSISEWFSGLFSSLSGWLSSLFSSIGSMFGGGGGGMGFGGILSSIAGILGFADGGWIPEPVLGKGLTSGRYYSFAENESERVMTKKDIGNINRSSGNQSANQRPVLNARIINVWDRSVVGDFLGTDAGEQIIMNIVKRNQGALAH